MHIAAANPMYVSEDEIDPAVLEKEKEILTAQALNEENPQTLLIKWWKAGLKSLKRNLSA